MTEVLKYEYVKHQNFKHQKTVERKKKRAEPVVTVTVRKLVNRRIFLLCLFLHSVEYS